MDGGIEQTSESVSHPLKLELNPQAAKTDSPTEDLVKDLRAEDPDKALERLASDNPEIVARTFAEAKARPKGFSDDFINGVLTGTLKSPDGGNAMFVKTYLDEVMPDQSELELAHSPESLADLHDRLANMVSENLKIGIVNGDEKTKSYLSSRKKNYQEKLKADSQKTREMLVKCKSGDRMAFNPVVAEYHGLSINTPEGEVDISGMGSKKVKGVRPNIRIQRELTGQFVHWETDQMLREVQGGAYPDLKKRIYLNPRTTDSVEVFTELMKIINEKGLSAKGKVYDRSYELMAQLNAREARPVRADTIVLYLKESDADPVLETVLEKYKEKPDLFQDRPTPKVPTRVAPGIAVGDEPSKEGASLTSHRADVISEAASKTRTQLGMGYENTIDPAKRGVALSEFRKTFKEVAVAYNVDPNNMAFNLAA